MWLIAAGFVDDVHVARQIFSNDVIDVLAEAMIDRTRRE